MRVTFTVPAQYRSYIEGKLREIEDTIGKNELGMKSQGFIPLPAFALDKGEGRIQVAVEILPSR